jgi:sporulation protein YlmC with PRC-barrel domain
LEPIGRHNKTSEEIMGAAFKLKGNDLFDNHGHKLAIVKGNDVYDNHGHKVAVIKGTDIYDDHGHKKAILKGTDIYDDHTHKIGTVKDVQKVIDGATGGPSVVALWLFFAK